MLHKTHLIALLSASLCAAVGFAEEEVSFLREVAPILLRRCAGCHGPQRAEGGYRIHTFQNLMTPGDSGEAPLVAGKPDESEFARRLFEKDDSLRMPREDDPLEPSQIKLIRRWIKAGGRFDGRNETTPLATQLPPRRHPDPPASYRVPVPVQALAFSPDGKQLAVAGYHEVTIWDVDTARLAGRVHPLPQRIQAVAWFRDSQLLVGGGTPGEYGELALVDLHPDQESKKRNAKAAAVVRVLDTFEDLVLAANVDVEGTRAVACSAARDTRVYRLPQGEPTWRARVHSDWVTGAAFSPDGKYVVTASRDQTLKVHLATDGKLFTTYNGHRRQLGKYAGRFAVFDVGFDRESGHALSAGEGRAVRVWRPEKAREENGTAADMENRFFKSGHTRYVEHQLKGPVFAMRVAAGAVFVAGADGVVKQFEFASGKHQRDYVGQRDWIFALDYVASRQLVAAGSYDGSVKIWSADDGDVHAEFVAAPRQR